jgi:NAD(P)H dehydrogenase (quinone)
MHVLLIYCHPCPDSFSATMLEVATEALRSAGHEVVVGQLYVERFDPVLGAEERRHYYDESFQRDTTAEHIASLQRAEALVFVYPTWWFGPPAMLKGWFDRVWLPGVAFRVGGPTVLQPLLTNIHRITVITTYGSPRWFLWLMGWPDWRFFKHGIRKLCARRCRLDWLALTGMDTNTAEDRQRFIDKIRVRLAGLN